MPDEEQPVEKPEETAEPQKKQKTGGRRLMPDGKGGYREAFDWEIERMRAKVREDKGECSWVCPTHGKFCARGGTHPGLGHACEDCIGTP